MAARSISGGVRSLMRTMYNAGAAEKENDFEVSPAKRRRTDEGDVMRDGKHRYEHSTTNPHEGITVKRQISSRNRRNRNNADHDGNEGDESSERANRDNLGGNELTKTGLEKSERVATRYVRRTRQANNTDHDGNSNESDSGHINGIVKGSNRYSVATPKNSNGATRQSSRIRNKGTNIDLNGCDGISMGGKMAKNLEIHKRHSINNISETINSQRPGSKLRHNRNDADHITNEEEFSEDNNGHSSTEHDVRSTDEQKKGNKGRAGVDTRHKAMYADSARIEKEKYNEQLSREYPTKQLSSRSRRIRNQTDHQGNEVEDSSLTTVQNGDTRLLTTPTKRLKSRRTDASHSISARSEIRTSPDELGITARLRGFLPEFRSEENHKIGTNGFLDRLDPEEIQSSPLSAGRRNQQSRRKGTSLEAPNSSTSHLSKHNQDSQLISENVIRGEACMSESFSDATALKVLRKVLRDRLTCNRSTRLIGIDIEYQKVYRLVEQTVSAGEGNSVLLIGARGCGKSAIVCKALEEVSREHSQAFYIIRLNGFFLTDDKMALREIWRQLGQEMEVEDETSGKNYADTLSKLLALLSYSGETDNGDSAATQKSLIFIMEEFDQFTSHPRQTLLYNLLDVAQSQKTPVAVIGMTTRIDIAESMEKRVKSRFSHRYIHIPLAKKYDTFRMICRANLECNSESLSPQELMQFGKFEKSLGKAKKDRKKNYGDFLEKWNSQVSKLMNEPSVDQFLRQKYDTSKSVPEAINALSASLCASLFDSGDFSGLEKEQSRIELLEDLDPPESKLIFLPHLPTLALALLISAARLEIVLDTDTVNFSMVYEEYSSLAGKARIESAAGGAITAGAGTKVWSREVAIREWDRLVSYGFLLPLQGTVAPFGMYRVDVALEEIAPSVPDLGRVLEKWCKQI